MLSCSYGEVSSLAIGVWVDGLPFLQSIHDIRRQPDQYGGVGLEDPVLPTGIDGIGMTFLIILNI
jgi:hypothetical protein